MIDRSRYLFFPNWAFLLLGEREKNIINQYDVKTTNSVDVYLINDEYLSSYICFVYSEKLNQGFYVDSKRQLIY